MLIDLDTVQVLAEFIGDPWTHTRFRRSCRAIRSRMRSRPRVDLKTFKCIVESVARAERITFAKWLRIDDIHSWSTMYDELDTFLPFVAVEEIMLEHLGSAKQEDFMRCMGRDRMEHLTVLGYKGRIDPAYWDLIGHHNSEIRHFPPWDPEPKSIDEIDRYLVLNPLERDSEEPCYSRHFSCLNGPNLTRERREMIAYQSVSSTGRVQLIEYMKAVIHVPPSVTADSFSK